MNTRREILAALGGTGAALLAGCSTSGEENTTINETPDRETIRPTQTVEKTTPNGSTTTVHTNTTLPKDKEEPQIFDEHYFEWIYGEDEQMLQDEVQSQFDFKEINKALEGDGSRVERVAEAAGIANEQYPNGGRHGDAYENRHRHIMAAVHQTLEQNDNIDFNIYSDVNAARIGGPIEISEIYVENEQGNYETALGTLYNRLTTKDGAIQYPSEKIGDGTVEEKLRELRDDSRLDITAQDLGAINDSMKALNSPEKMSEDEQQNAWGSWMQQFGYTIVGGGQEVDQKSEILPDEPLIPRDKTSMKVSHQAKYGDKDFSIWADLTESYLNSEFADTEEYTAAEWTGEEWKFEAAPGWEKEDGFSYFAS